MIFFYVSFLFILPLNICFGKNVEVEKLNVLRKTPFLYGNYLYEKFCRESDKTLKCGKENIGNANITACWENQIIDSVFVNLNITNFLENGKLLVGREADIEALTFSNNSITFVESGTFDNFISLKILNFWNTNLTTIDETVLTKSLGSHLSFLNLNDNKNLFLPSSAFKYLKRLYQLNLDGNQHVGKFINNGMFPKSMNKLQWLYLNNCNITILNDDVFANLTGLKYLLLSKNPCSSIPKAINIIPELFLLSLAFTQIKSIKNDAEIHNKNLQYLSFPGSKELLNIDDCGLCNFPNLDTLDLRFCKKLSSIHPNAFGSKKEMPELVDIKMESCNISTLPEIIFMRRLRIYLDDNPINNKGIITINV